MIAEYRLQTCMSLGAVPGGTLSAEQTELGPGEHVEDERCQTEAAFP